MTVARSSQAAAVNLLLSMHADVHACDSAGRTVLHHAAASGSTAIVKSLLAVAPALVNTPDNTGETPLACAVRTNKAAVFAMLLDKSQHGTLEAAWHAAAEHGRILFLSALLARGATVNGTHGINNRTALQCAAGNGHDVIVEKLLTVGAAVNAAGPDGITALHLAVQSSHAGVISRLLAAGAAPGAEDREGWTPLHHAAKTSPPANPAATVARTPLGCRLSRTKDSGHAADAYGCCAARTCRSCQGARAGWRQRGSTASRPQDRPDASRSPRSHPSD